MDTVANLRPIFGHCWRCVNIQTNVCDWKIVFGVLCNTVCRTLSQNFTKMLRQRRATSVGGSRQPKKQKEILLARRYPDQMVERVHSASQLQLLMTKINRIPAEDKQAERNGTLPKMLIFISSDLTKVLKLF